jgi:hypothetical protein
MLGSFFESDSGQGSVLEATDWFVRWLFHSLVKLVGWLSNWITVGCLLSKLLIWRLAAEISIRQIKCR